MPLYNNTPFKGQIRQMVNALPTYLFGAFDDKSAPTKFQVTSVSLTSNVATYTGYIREGNIPVVGNLISFDNGAPSPYNVSDAAITGVTISSVTGIGTITVAITHADIAAANAGFIGMVTAPETSEATGTTASIPVVPSFNSPLTTDERTLTLIVTFPTEPTTWTGNLQVALRDVDSEYVNINSAADITFVSGTDIYLVQYYCQSGRFYRLKPGSSSTTDGKIIAKIMP